MKTFQDCLMNALTDASAMRSMLDQKGKSALGVSRGNLDTLARLRGILADIDTELKAGTIQAEAEAEALAREAAKSDDFLRTLGRRA